MRKVIRVTSNPSSQKIVVFHICRISVALPRKQELNKQPQIQKNIIWRTASKTSNGNKRLVKKSRQNYLPTVVTTLPAKINALPKLHMVFESKLCLCFKMASSLYQSSSVMLYFSLSIFRDSLNKDLSLISLLISSAWKTSAPIIMQVVKKQEKISNFLMSLSKIISISFMQTITFWPPVDKTEIHSKLVYQKGINTFDFSVLSHYQINRAKSCHYQQGHCL